MTYEEWSKPKIKRYFENDGPWGWWYDSRGRRVLYDEETYLNSVWGFYRGLEYEWKDWIYLLASIKERIEKQNNLSHRLLPEHIESTRALYDFTDKIGDQIELSDYMRTICKM